MQTFPQKIAIAKCFSSKREAVQKVKTGTSPSRSRNLMAFQEGAGDRTGCFI